MRKIQCYNQNMIPESLSNICFMGKTYAEELRQALVDTNTTEEFLQTAVDLTNLPWKIATANETLVKLTYEDSLGNITYLSGRFPQTKYNTEDITRAEAYLISHGVAKVEAKIVLQELGHILLHEDVYGDE